MDIGDSVQLISGGPVMTVTEVRYPYAGKKSEAMCIWFDHANELKKSVFFVGTLEYWFPDIKKRKSAGKRTRPGHGKTGKSK